ncbi:hypothetical protein [Spirosoma spitsbergense]|uniref:hypothetical protein n=1 Tax=Spirosoma spitsbergense TaxID=431554 RepID=UPI0003823A3F|nr:hypothetical protein [Spirosoma spitsbergense]
MKTAKILASSVIVLLVFWHTAVALSSKLSVCGPFLAKPAKPGYAWVNTNNSDARFFWQSTDLAWQAGIAHPEYSAETTGTEGVWAPLPGYSFVDQSKDLQTVWKAGLIHPDYKAWSDDVEGMWIPVTGYKFIYEGDTFVESVWDPNKRYDDLKVMSLTEQDRYQPYPGYTFSNPGQSLDVVWTPGTINPDNSQLIAGTKEGTWNVNSNRVASRSGGRRRNNNGLWFLGGVATGVILRSVIR